MEVSKSFLHPSEKQTAGTGPYRLFFCSLNSRYCLGYLSSLSRCSMATGKACMVNSFLRKCVSATVLSYRRVSAA